MAVAAHGGSRARRACAYSGNRVFLKVGVGHEAQNRQFPVLALVEQGMGCAAMLTPRVDTRRGTAPGAQHRGVQVLPRPALIAVGKRVTATMPRAPQAAQALALLSVVLLLALSRSGARGRTFALASRSLPGPAPQGDVGHSHPILLTRACLRGARQGPGAPFRTAQLFGSYRPPASDPCLCPFDPRSTRGKLRTAHTAFDHARRSVNAACRAAFARSSVLGTLTQRTGEESALDENTASDEDELKRTYGALGNRAVAASGTADPISRTAPLTPEEEKEVIKEVTADMEKRDAAKRALRGLPPLTAEQRASTDAIAASVLSESTENHWPPAATHAVKMNGTRAHIAGTECTDMSPAEVVAFSNGATWRYVVLRLTSALQTACQRKGQNLCPQPWHAADACPRTTNKNITEVSLCRDNVIV